METSTPKKTNEMTSNSMMDSPAANEKGLNTKRDSRPDVQPKLAGETDENTEEIEGQDNIEGDLQAGGA